MICGYDDHASTQALVTAMRANGVETSPGRASTLPSLWFNAQFVTAWQLLGGEHAATSAEAHEYTGAAEVQGTPTESACEVASIRALREAVEAARLDDTQVWSLYEGSPSYADDRCFEPTDPQWNRNPLVVEEPITVLGTRTH